MTKLAIVAAMEDEIRPLVRDWRQIAIPCATGTLLGYERGELLAVAGGIGSKRAEQAARAVVGKYRPETLISAGLAGALIRSLKVGKIVLPSIVVDAETGEEYRCDTEENVISGGVLVTAGMVAGSETKAKLVESHHALVVDMEAAGVARVARQFGLKVRCVKAISDEFEFRMPPLNEFIAHGAIQKSKFALWVAMRPHYWASTMRLARSSRLATQALADWLKQHLCGRLPNERVVTLDTADHLKT